MIKNKLAKVVFGSTFLTAMIVPAIALAQEEAATVAEDPKVGIARFAAAGASMVTAALATAFAQSKIGSAGAGTLAGRRPDPDRSAVDLRA